MPSEEHQRRLPREDLLGAWEAFQGGGLHEWSRGVIVFKPYGRDVMVEHWLAAQSKTSMATRLESLRGSCSDAPFGLRLQVRGKTGERTIDIVRAGDDMISIFFPGTSTSAQLFRRTMHPLFARTPF
jgi:hypothetical protein